MPRSLRSRVLLGSVLWTSELYGGTMALQSAHLGGLGARLRLPAA